MATYYGIKPNLSGLILYYDMDNLQKSWRGRPATNFYTNGHFADGAGMPQESGSNATNTVIRLPGNPGDTDFVLEQSMGVAFTEYQINLTTQLVSNTTYVLSGWYGESSDYSSADGSRMFHCRAFSASGANVALGIGIGTVLATRVINGITWRYCYATITTPADYSNDFNWYLGYGGSSYTGKRYYTNLQMEVGSFPTRFVNGTRSNTQAIIDLTGNNTLTASSLTYNNDGTFSFNGSSDHITCSGPSTAVGTIIAWVKLSTAAGGDYIVYGLDANGADNWFGINANRVNLFATQTSDVNNFTLQGTTTLSSGVWYQIACTLNGATAKVYLNGFEENSVTQAFTIGAWNTSATIGRRGSIASRYFPGNIGLVQAYNTVLTNNQILENFTAFRGRYGV